MNRHEKRKQRLQLMHKLNQLELLRCDKCVNGKGDYTKMHCNCKVANAIRDIGNDLSRDPTKITVTRYKKLKKEGLTDTEIGMKYGVSKSTIHYFKRKNNIGFKRRMTN